MEARTKLEKKIQEAPTALLRDTYEKAQEHFTENIGKSETERASAALVMDLIERELEVR